MCFFFNSNNDVEFGSLNLLPLHILQVYIIHILLLIWRHNNAIVEAVMSYNLILVIEQLFD